jgi:AraC family transcriptional regulator
LYDAEGEGVLVKLAAAVAAAIDERARLGTKGLAAARLLARGPHWSVEDVVCTCTPDDRPFEEQHAGVAVAIVVAGTFQYRSPAGRALMTPGSLLLGNDRQCFRCSHEHAAGDRCLSFHFAAEYFAALAADAGVRHPEVPFDSPRLPLSRPLAPLVARARTRLASGSIDALDDWRHLATDLAIGVVRLLATGQAAPRPALPVHERRVTELVRQIDAHPGDAYTLEALAQAVDLSPFHFARIFQDVTGCSPHQYVMRMRLQHAAAHLAARSAKVLDIALDAGFGDVSNFNHAFKREFGASPRAFGLRHGPASAAASDHF